MKYLQNKWQEFERSSYWIRLNILFGIVFLIPLILYLVYLKLEFPSFELSSWFGALVVLFALLSAGSGLVRYLGSGREVEVRSRATSDLSPTRRSLAASIEGLNRKVQDLMDGTAHALTTEEKETLRADLKRELESVVAADLLKQIEVKFSATIVEDAQVERIRDALETTSTRLRTEIGALTRRANLNLVIGILTTGVAVGLLVYLVSGSVTLTSGSIVEVLSHFVPRISVAVFIEVFSFFFLKLYKLNLQEIKYFQNELTNVEMKGLALDAALLKSESSSRGAIIAELIRTDRNLGIDRTAPNGNQLEAKEVVEVIDKITKLVSVGRS